MNIGYEQAVEAASGEQGLVEPDTGLRPRRRVLRRFVRNAPAMFGLAIIVLVVLAALLAPVLEPYDHASTDFEPLQGPSAEHWLGTDKVGRDLLSRLVYGARASLEVGVLVMVFASLIAVPLGLIAGYFGGLFDAVIMRVMDALFTLPALMLALAVAALLGQSIANAAIAIAIAFVPGFVRLVRAQVLAVREETFVEASRSVGAGDLRMLGRHVFPNVASPLVVQVALGLAYAILAESGLSFLGFGVTDPPTPSWGSMLQVGYQSVQESVWPLVPPGLAILFTVLAFNLVADGMRDALGREEFGVRETAA